MVLLQVDDPKLIPMIKKYQQDLIQQPIHLYEWTSITDIIADLIEEDQFPILEHLNNMFFLYKEQRYKRLYKLETGALNKESIESLEIFINQVNSDSILAKDFLDLQPLYIRALACVFGVELKYIRPYFRNVTEFKSSTIGDLDRLLHDLCKLDIYEESSKELMGISHYDIPYPNFKFSNQVNNEAFPRLLFIAEPKYHFSCGNLSHFKVNGCECKKCNNSCPCQNLVDFSICDDLVVGCTDSCKCTNCNGFKYASKDSSEYNSDKMEVFMTNDNRGWGVRALITIQKNEYVGEYVGEVYSPKIERHRQHLYGLFGQMYTFGIDRHVLTDSSDPPSFFLDATYYGNITRFFNHDCHNPNIRQIFVPFYSFSFMVTTKLQNCSELGLKLPKRYCLVKNCCLIMENLLKICLESLVYVHLVKIDQKREKESKFINNVTNAAVLIQFHTSYDYIIIFRRFNSFQGCQHVFFINPVIKILSEYTK